MYRIILLALLLCVCLASESAAQVVNTAYQDIPLDDLSAFQETTSNWQLAEKVVADRTERHQFDMTPGTGILVNAQTDDARGHLFTSWTHSDIELDLEVMMPNGSNSGIYFQGRYEIQLLDSWGKEELSIADMGAVYQRWDDSRPEGERGYEGYTPPVNVARAPGLWQHLNIVFQAPRFDSEGNKTQNARFVSVTLNGVLLHENVEVTGPTRAAAFEDEVASAPIMIQGDHGPVAFRHIKYRLFQPEPVSLSDIEYTYYEGEFPHQMPALEDLRQVVRQPAERISALRARAQKQFALQFTGNILLPRSGQYTFEVSHTARFRLFIDGREILGDNSSNTASIGEFPRREVSIPLTRGAHSFELRYAKGLWHNVPTALGWYVSGPGVLKTELTAPESLPADAFGAYRLDPDAEPVLQRNFVLHKDKARTHAISVGFPGKIHYAYDMSQGALLHVWKGPFVDTSTMWYQRGNQQSAVPVGSVIEQSGTPAVLVADENSAGGYRDSSAYRFENYRLDANGRPSYTYRVGDATVKDKIVPDDSANYLTRSLIVDPGNSNEVIRCVLLESDYIEELSDGVYAVDDQKMYLEIVEGGRPVIQDNEDTKQLVIPVSNSDESTVIRYHLIW